MAELIVSATALYAFIWKSKNAKVSKMAYFFIIRLLFNYKSLYRIRSESSRKMMGNVRVISFSLLEG